jgi:hypothetical protein
MEKTIMSKEFPSVPKSTVITIGNKQYVTKEGMFAVAYKVAQDTPYRIEYDIEYTEAFGHKVAKCTGRLYKTSLTEEKQAAYNLLKNIADGPNASLVHTLIDIIGKPDITDIAIRTLPLGKDGTMHPDDLKNFEKKLITNVKMRLMQEFTGGGYAIPDDVTEDSIEGLPIERQAVAIELGVQNLKDREAQAAMDEGPKDKAGILREIGELCIGNLANSDKKTAYMKENSIVRPSQMTLEQGQALLAILKGGE